MCHRVTCRTCGKPSYAGCGMHIEQVLGDVPRDRRCRCREERAAAREAAAAAKKAAAAARKAAGGRLSWWERLLSK